MGDISTWNPVDNSNTAPPPDGWPESMAPSAVNNSARAMMGAVRRWYDTVTADLAMISNAFANYLPLTGGTVTGNLTVSGQLNAQQLYVDALLTIDRGVSLGETLIFKPGGSYALNLQANDSYYQTNTHHFANSAGAATFTVDSAGNGSFAGNVGTAGTVTGAQLTSTGNANVAGTSTAAQLTSTGNINAAGTVTGTSFIGNVSVPSNGPISTGGTVTGGQVTSTGNANVAGAMTAGSVHATGTLQVDAAATINDTLYVAGPVTFQNSLTVNGACGNVDGTWHIISDARMKTGIADYKPGLEAILALRPCVYHYRPELFGPKEAENTRYGLVADEVAPVLPEMVGETMLGGRNLSTLNTGHISIVLINACRELAEQNAALAARITALEGTHV